MICRGRDARLYEVDGKGKLDRLRRGGEEAEMSDWYFYGGDGVEGGGLSADLVQHK
jgi:hypothetical protein